MVTRSDAPDLAVDELKRRARRRLVGAIVLALAAAVSLPLLLESEPKPLGDEVSIQIPPVDNSKFVNPLSPGKVSESRGGDGTAKKTVPAAAPAITSPPASAPPPPNAAGDTRPPPDTGSVATTALPSAATPPASAPEKGGDDKPAISPAAPAALPAAPETKKQSAVDSKASAKQAPQPEAAQSGGAYVVQIAAYTDRYGALAQVRKLKRAGYPAFVEATPTDKGELQRVRVGPYTSRDSADVARAKLKSAGYDAIVARAR
jgi:DedD protein